LELALDRNFYSIDFVYLFHKVDKGKFKMYDGRLLSFVLYVMFSNV